MVEHDAKAQGIACTEAHLELRRTRTRPLLAKLLCWTRQQRDRHPPKSKMGRAVNYMLNNHRELTRFTVDARVPPDKCRSEAAALRVVVLGRKNFLFVGHSLKS